MMIHTFEKTCKIIYYYLLVLKPHLARQPSRPLPEMKHTLLRYSMTKRRTTQAILLRARRTPMFLPSEFGGTQGGQVNTLPYVQCRSSLEILPKGMLCARATGSICYPCCSISYLRGSSASDPLCIGNAINMKMSVLRRSWNRCLDFCTCAFKIFAKLPSPLSLCQVLDPTEASVRG